MRVPPTASPAIQQAFREIHQQLDRLGVGRLNTDYNGKRIINAGDAQDAADLVTLRQLNAVAARIPVPARHSNQLPTAPAASNGPVIPNPPPNPPPPPTFPPATGTIDPTDMLNLATVTYVASPNVTAWTQTATLTAFDWQASGVFVNFTLKSGAGRWPDYTPPGWDGPLQYTLWLFLQIGGIWYGAGLIQFWYGLDRNGGPPSKAAFNWTGGNKSIWSPINSSHQPAVGDSVGFMLSAGNARNETGVTSLAERTQTILIPFPSDNGGTYTTL